MQTFEEMNVWKESKLLTLSVYKIFASSKDFSFRDQIQRASVFIMNNIAEGFERRSEKEFKHFLFIAKGSAGEVRSMLYISKNLNYISDEKYHELLGQVTSISKMLSGLIKTLT